MPIRVDPPSGSTGRATPRGVRSTPPGYRPGGSSKKKKGASIGGLLGNIGGGLRDFAVGSGPGFVELGRALYDVHGYVPGDRRGGSTERFERMGAGIAKDFETRWGPLFEGFGQREGWRPNVGEFAHQLYENPVPFAFDIGTVASAGAGGAARAGALVKTGSLRVRPELRFAKIPEAEAKVLLGTYSRAALTRRTQKFLDSIRQRFPNAPIMGRSLYRKVGFQQDRLGQVDERLGRAGAAEVAALGKKLTVPEHRALRVVGEGVALDTRLARHRRDLAAAKSARQRKQRKRLKREISLLTKARPYLDETGTKLADPKLQKVYDLVTASATRREDILAAVDELAPEKAAARVQKPAGFFGEGEGDVFFTYSDKKRPTTMSRLGAARTIRHPRKPGTTQEFTGEAITQGRIPRQEAMLAAEAELEAWRFTTILRNRDRLEAMAKPTPTKGSDVALVLDELKGKTLPEEVRAFLDKAAGSEMLPAEELTALARVGEGLKQQMFPGKWSELQRLEQFAAAADTPIPGVVWVDQRLLGGLHATNPLVGFSGNTAAKAGLSVVDTINNAQKAALLYLLPLKYIAPNLISQAAFAIIQQGFAAPINVGRAARMNARLGAKATTAIDAGMGEGFVASIAGSTTGPLTRMNNAAARGYGKVIDLPFRRAAFMHEAARHGFKTPDELDKLLFEPALKDRRLAVFLDANSEIVDYARLGKYERNVVRRVIFFYPWVKGATVWQARFITEHPFQAWALDQIGKAGSEAQASVLGAQLPSYGEALAPIGESGGLPTTLNLAALSPWTTGYQSLRAVTGDQRGAYALGSQFSPALTALIMAAGFTPPGGYEAGPAAAARELYEGLPQVRYPMRIIQGTEGRVYPTTPTEDLLSLILGTGVVPRRTDPKKLKDEYERGR